MLTPYEVHFGEVKKTFLDQHVSDPGLREGKTGGDDPETILSLLKKRAASSEVHQQTPTTTGATIQRNAFDLIVPESNMIRGVYNATLLTQWVAMITDVQLAVFANVLGVTLFLLVVLYHYIAANNSK
uniref:Dolichyl-diphosphooligosaccharide--protein glycosyltransferase subunit 4 n=1 Tax=Timema monikensis TaxID=170555 RepID=A0A7R9EK20_9NEOP|nr:unnamed protein product [Timema monikensis]